MDVVIFTFGALVVLVIIALVAGGFASMRPDMERQKTVEDARQDIDRAVRNQQRARVEVASFEQPQGGFTLRPVVTLDDLRNGR